MRKGILKKGRLKTPKAVLPSLYASVYGIRGRTRQFEILSGFGVRPMARIQRRKRKKR